MQQTIEGVTAKVFDGDGRSYRKLKGVVRSPSQMSRDRLGRVQLNAGIPAQLAEDLREFAYQNRMAIADVVERAVAKYIAEYKCCPTCGKAK